MHLEQVEIHLDDHVTIWLPGNEALPLTVKENQKVKIRICIGSAGAIFQVPRLDLEDLSIPLQREDFTDENGRRVVAFSSFPDRIFRESFGVAFLRVYMGEEEFPLPFEVLATKVTAAQTERMIRYLAEQRENIIRVCLARTKRPAGMTNDGRADPEVVLSTAERIINTLLDCRGELRHHIHSKLVPSKVPAWRAEQSGSLIDPIDVIFNIDSLRPSDGRQDVVLRGRTYSTSAIDATTLVSNTNVPENSVLLGGLYSIRRVISLLMGEISGAFKGRLIASYDKEYVSLGEMLIKLTGGAMYERCERVLTSAETLIWMLERDFGIEFKGEAHPKITPYVRSSRLYRNIFDQYHRWYNLGNPSIDGDLFLIKLRSLSKIFEFYVLFRLFEYLIKKEWIITDFSLSDEFEKLIPNTISFEKNDIKINLSYEQNIFTHSSRTRHMDLIKIAHPEHPGNRWCPDYTLRIEDMSRGVTRYLILDAKYSTPYWVENSHLKKIHDKYYVHMAVFDEPKNFISRNEILGIFAIYPEHHDQAHKSISINQSKFSLDGRGPLMIPMAAGLPIGFETGISINKWLDKILDITLFTIKGDHRELRSETA